MNIPVLLHVLRGRLQYQDPWRCDSHSRTRRGRRNVGRYSPIAFDSIQAWQSASAFSELGVVERLERSSSRGDPN